MRAPAAFRCCFHVAISLMRRVGSSILRSRHWPRSTPISISTKDLGALEFAGGSFAFTQHRGELIAFGLAQFDPITYIHPDLLVGGPDESKSESKIRRRSRPQRSKL